MLWSNTSPRYNTVERTDSDCSYTSGDIAFSATNWKQHHPVQIRAAVSKSTAALGQQRTLQLSWCKEGGEHKQVSGAGFWCKSRSYSTDVGKAASDLHQESSDQYAVFNIHFATRY